MDINQPIVVIKDKRDPIDLRCEHEHNVTMKIGYYEGRFPWAVAFYDGKEWIEGIYDYGEYESGEMVTIENVPMKSLYSLEHKRGERFALPIYRHRFVVGKSKVWEHEIDYQVIKK